MTFKEDTEQWKDLKGKQQEPPEAHSLGGTVEGNQVV